jgi:hypothetical protein
VQCCSATCGASKQLFFVDAIRAGDLLDSRFTQGQRAGFVEEYGLNGSDALKILPAFNQNPGLCRTAQSGGSLQGVTSTPQVLPVVADL